MLFPPFAGVCWAGWPPGSSRQQRCQGWQTFVRHFCAFCSPRLPSCVQICHHRFLANRARWDLQACPDPLVPQACRWDMNNACSAAVVVHPLTSLLGAVLQGTNGNGGIPGSPGEDGPAVSIITSRFTSGPRTTCYWHIAGTVRGPRRAPSSTSVPDSLWNVLSWCGCVDVLRPLLQFNIVYHLREPMGLLGVLVPRETLVRRWDEPNTADGRSDWRTDERTDWRTYGRRDQRSAALYE